MDPNFMNTIRLSEYDNVVVARSKLEFGMMVDQSQVIATEQIGAGHKIATEVNGLSAPLILVSRGLSLSRWLRSCGIACWEPWPLSFALPLQPSCQRATRTFPLGP